MKETTYRGYSIEPSEILWKPCYEYAPLNGSWDECVRIAETIEEAKEEIDEIIEANL